MPLELERAFVVFHCGGKLSALPLEGVQRIAPMTELAQPPGMPATLAGLLNLGGVSVPVLRLASLLGLPEKEPGLHSMLLLAKLDKERPPVAMLVDRVREILHVSHDKLLPVGKEHFFNACVQGVIQASKRADEQAIHVLAPGRILLEKEERILAAFLDRERSRLADWGTAIQ